MLEAFNLKTQEVSSTDTECCWYNVSMKDHFHCVCLLRSLCVTPGKNRRRIESLDLESRAAHTLAAQVGHRWQLNPLANGCGKSVAIYSLRPGLPQWSGRGTWLVSGNITKQWSKNKMHHSNHKSVWCQIKYTVKMTKCNSLVLETKGRPIRWLGHFFRTTHQDSNREKEKRPKTTCDRLMSERRVP